tara:strand:+ start:637 stop:879 length:243 start_codon:yes stop_codon:yes gene_type:complete
MMTVLIVVAGLVFGTFTYEPSWFDTRPHYYSKTYNSQKQCQLVRGILADLDKDDMDSEPLGTVCTDKHELYTTDKEVSNG